MRQALRNNGSEIGPTEAIHSDEVRCCYDSVVGTVQELSKIVRVSNKLCHPKRPDRLFDTGDIRCEGGRINLTLAQVCLAH